MSLSKLLLLNKLTVYYIKGSFTNDQNNEYFSTRIFSKCEDLKSNYIKGSFANLLV